MTDGPASASNVRQAGVFEVRGGLYPRKVVGRGGSVSPSVCEGKEGTI